MITKNVPLKLLLFFVPIFMFSCGEDNLDIEENQVQTNAKKEDLIGVWSIYKVAKNGVENTVPVNFKECGRDFFIYNNNDYEEFVFQESTNCIPNQNILSWTLNNGVITLSKIDNSESETIRIKALNKNNFVFTANIDLNGTGVKETYTFTALKYQPPNEMDVYTSTFQRKEEEPFVNHIEYGWNKYKGYNKFIKYEILRSDKNCNLNNAEIIKTITDVDNNSFIEENPLSAKEFCYFFKIYTNKGLLGESDPRYVNTELIYPKNVKLNNADANNNSVTLGWEKYTGYYFSHYEIRVQDQNENSSPNVESVKIISDINTTSFTDDNPPYVNNPVYSVYVHNIFGNISYVPQKVNMLKTNFVRPEILNFDYIKFLSIDKESHAFYFYGQTPNNEYRLIKYDYLNKKITAEAFKLPTSYTEVEMKLITSTNGKELFFSEVGELLVYDAETLNFKYSLDTGYAYIESFNYLENDIWAVSDNNSIYTFKRNKDKFLKIDKKSHFTKHQGGINYEITKIDNNKILVSHNNEGRAIHYSIHEDGEITNNGIKEIPLKFKYNSDVSVSNNLILNKMRNTVYSAIDFSQLYSYSNPISTLNFNYSATVIYGTNNGTGSGKPKEEYKKELIVYDFINDKTSILTTKGYPMYVFEDSLGNIVSLSSGFPRDEYYDTHHSNEPDIFVEIVK